MKRKPMRGTKPALVVVAALALVAAVGTGTWAAMSDDERFTSGACDASNYRLEAETEGDAYEVSFEVQSSAPGETWDVVIEQDGAPILDGQRMTDEDAEIDVDVTVRDAADGDEFTATATPSGGGEPCTATLTR
ncbi:hypothetical protein H5V45_21190 [Nocardioides sp. KIGAM211]|uniref:Uncharacterized protein n=1 Tax=Nocardioides luti TaxID=2761101 RepID=A0A7X0VDA4_9ACTN|nr:hypothetical protein [Nocardioides luti]MBB6629847.1 hypothetical protein [Nocardioides luti]